ncbi:MAG: alpha/beta fold hydrolase [Dehalococcoidia bacterium]
MLPDLKKYERFQDLTNGRVRYYEAGEGDDHTFLLHGMGTQTSADTFAFIFEKLAEKLHVYNIDMLGFGKSTRQMAYGPTFEVIIDGIREFMDVKGLSKVNLIGHSAGGWFGSILAYESPDRINKLVMIGSAGMNVTPVATVSSPPKPSLEGSLAGTRAAVYEGSDFTPEQATWLGENMFEMATQPGVAEGGMRPLLNQMATPEIRNHWLIQRRLPYIKAPTLVIWGKGDTMEPFPTWTEEWEKIGGDVSKSSKPWVIPGAKYVLVDAGHNSHWERPTEISDMILDFLK